MFGLRQDRRNTRGTSPARANVEELEPRTLLATSPLASLLAPLSNPLGLLGMTPALSPSAVPPPAVASVPTTPSPVAPVSTVPPPGPSAGSPPPAPVTGGSAPSGNLTTLPGGTPGSTHSAVQPAPNAPLPRGVEGIPPPAIELSPEAGPEDRGRGWAWATDRYFAEESLAVARGVDGLPSLGTAEGAGGGAASHEARPHPAALADLLSAVAGVGLLNGVRRPQEDREPPHRRRPAVVPIGPR
jgi:hypothetical protein